MSRAVRHRYQGRAEGPVQQRGEVVDRRRLGRYWGITVTAGEIASRSEPGQFVNVAVDVAGTLLRRPFSLAGASSSGPVAGTIDIVVDPHGPGTNALGAVRTGDRLTVMGPLGRPFPMPQRRVSAVLVGGGYGAAPLYYLGNRLRAAGHKVGFVIGAADQHRIVDPIVPKRMATMTRFTTEDGSMGEQGRVTDVLRQALRSADAEVVYACGPNGMLAAVSAISEDLGIPCQVAVEEHMACGVGVCMTCVLPIRDRHGDVHHRRVCLDGPVFTSTRIDWSQSRYGLGDRTNTAASAATTTPPATGDPGPDAGTSADSGGPGDPDGAARGTQSVAPASGASAEQNASGHPTGPRVVIDQNGARHEPELDDQPPAGGDRGTPDTSDASESRGGLWDGRHRGTPGGSR